MGHDQDVLETNPSTFLLGLYARRKEGVMRASS